MTRTRAWLSFATLAASILIACGQSGQSGSPENQAAAAPTPTAAPAPAPAPTPAPAPSPTPPSIDVPYALPVAKAIVPLPDAPAAYIFIEADGAMRVGATPAFTAATQVADVASLPKLIPPPPGASATPTAGDDDAPAGWSTIGPGRYGPIAPGMGVTHALVAERSDPAAARVVLVPAAPASLGSLAAVLTASPEPVAIAAQDEHGTKGALSLTLRRGSSGVSIPLVLYALSPLSELVAAVDATPIDTKEIAISVRTRAMGMRSARLRVPQVRIGTADVVGTLDKNIIRRYIKRNIARITYCYEKQLLTKPGLEGTVTVEFVIGPQGNVPSTKADGMDRVVAKCVADVIHKIEFPKPQAGGIVKVTYPFTFSPEGG